ncbi:MAG: hypothetical protein HQM01_01780 [Magnetococcales bacterium]|nr:hypothetical protein [Magnetococcales bacterium]
MKKSILLGAAALAAIALAAPQAADAGEVKLGGYYVFRAVSTDNTVTNQVDDQNSNFWAQRLQLNVDMKASEKSHAHMVTRVLDGKTVEGSDQVFGQGAASMNASTGATAGAIGSGNSGNLGAADWQVRQLWLETEAWGVGVKVGNMPIALNDGLLVDNDVTSFGTILLAKNFGGVTVVAADVKVDEGATTSTDANSATKWDNDKDIDLYVLSALGKLNEVNYQLTGAWLNAQGHFAVPPTAASAATPGLALVNGTKATDGWVALTLSSKVEGIDLIGTAIYEKGVNFTGGANNTQLEKSGLFVGARAKGVTGFGGWNGYAFYGDKNFTSPLLWNNEAKWSSAWDSSGPGSQDLMQRALTNRAGNSTNKIGANGLAVAANAGSGIVTSGGDFSNESNMWGTGAGLSINVGAWTIKPSLDYAHVVEENDVNLGIQANVVSAWGGTLGFSTKIQEGTTLDLSGTWVNPKETDNFAKELSRTNMSMDNMHYLQASVRMDF